MATTITVGDLSTLTLTGTELANLGQILGMINVTATGATFDTTAKTITIPNLGVFHVNSTTAPTLIDFTADASLTGAFTFTANANNPWNTITSNATGLAITTDSGSVVGGAGNDILAATAVGVTLNGGAGNDVLTAANVAGTTNLTGGTGADTFTGVALSTPNITDYSYTDGDVVKTADATANAAVTVDGAGIVTITPTLGGAVTVNSLTVGTDNAYKLKVSNSAATAATVDYWTAATGKAVTLDASAVANAVVVKGGDQTAVITTGAGNDTVTAATLGGQVTTGAGDDSITATNAASDTISAGAGTNTIIMTDTTASDTLVVSKAQTAADAVTGFVASAAATADVLNLTDAVAGDVVYNATANTLTVGNTVITGAAALGAAGAGLFTKVQENGGNAKLVAFADHGVATTFTVASAAADASAYYGSTAADTVDYAAYETDGLRVDLQDYTKYKSIENIIAATNATGMYNGGTTGSTTGTNINAAAATKSVSIWGGSANADTIALNNAATVGSTVYYGTTDGADAVTGFKDGFTAAKDTVKLWNTDASAVTLTATGLLQVGTNTSNVLNLDSVVASATGVAGNAQVKFEDQNGNTAKVAFVIGATHTVDGTGATLVKGTSALDETVSYSAAQDASTVSGWINLLDATKYQGIENVNLSSFSTGDSTVVGTAGNNAIVLGGATAQVWTGVGNDTVTASTGNDTIWFGAGDGNDSVGSFATAGNDTIRIFDWNKSLSDITQDYTVTGAVNSTISNGTDTLTLTSKNLADSTFNLVTSDGVAVKAAVASTVVTGTHTGAAVYDSTVKSYFGSGTSTLTVTTSSDTIIDLDNGEDGLSFGNGYYNGYNEINGSTSTGKLTLVGAASKSNSLTAGNAGSDMWGGGLGMDTMKGAAGVDKFWFGTNDGIDTVQTVGGEDIVVLYNTTDINSLTAAASNGTDLVVSANNGASLTITGGVAAAAAGLTFQVGSDASTATNYTYSATTGFTKK